LALSGIKEAKGFVGRTAGRFYLQPSRKTCQPGAHRIRRLRMTEFLQCLRRNYDLGVEFREKAR
jgi:hypothetical protein